MAALAMASCGKPAVDPRPVDAAAAPPDLARAPLPVQASLRCEECHGRASAEWKGSAHAQADRAPLFVAMRAQVRTGVEECDRCHAPFVGVTDAGEPGAHEGVNCEACHGVREVEVRRRGRTFTLHTEENVKYGPLCDAKDHYFHKMGCSPLHEESRFCAACHLWYRALPDGSELPVFTEYEEWVDGPYNGMGMDCQRCHMPGTRAEVAAGAGQRPSVHGHGFLGGDGRLRRRALTLDLRATKAGGRLHVEADLANVGAGHAVPSGMPGRQVILRVRATDKRGREFARDERRYGRTLVDERGAEAPFFAAVRVASDSRIAPRDVRHESFDLDGGKATEVRAEVLWSAASPALAATLGVAPPAAEVMAEKRVPVRAERKRKRGRR